MLIFDALFFRDRCLWGRKKIRSCRRREWQGFPSPGAGGGRRTILPRLENASQPARRFRPRNCVSIRLPPRHVKASPGRNCEACLLLPQRLLSSLSWSVAGWIEYPSMSAFLCLCLCLSVCSALGCWIPKHLFFVCFCLCLCVLECVRFEHLQIANLVYLPRKNRRSTLQS